MSEIYLKTEGLVLREVKYKEADRIITVLTKERGKITAKARGALRKTSSLGASTQQLMYSDFVFFEHKDMLTVQEATVEEAFEGLRSDFTSFALGCYFAEVAEALTRDEIAEPQILQLTLNSLYALSNTLYDRSHIKAAFEMRLASVLGYAPDLSKCFVCGNTEPENPTIGIETGHLCCRECRNSQIGPTDYLSKSALAAMRQIITLPARQVFSYARQADDGYLNNACEDYLLVHASRRFGTLDYYKQLKSFDNYTEQLINGKADST